MGVLVRDSIVYVFMYVLIFCSIGVARELTLGTIFLMIDIWGIPGNVRRGPIPFSSICSVFADVLHRGVVPSSPHTPKNEASVVIPRLVISSWENYEEDGQPIHHGGNARQTIRCDKMVFRRRAMTVCFELQTVDRAPQPG